MALIVYCPDPVVARQYRAMTPSEGLNWTFRYFVVTPDDLPLVTDIEAARVIPTTVLLAALCHSGDDDVDAAFPALAEAMLTIGPERAVSYRDAVRAGFPPALRTRWEAFMAGDGSLANLR